MTEINANRLKQLILKEIELREQFKEAKAKLETLIQPLSDHNLDCVRLWQELFDSDTSGIIVMMDNGLCLEVKQPVRELASVETYMPYGMDFTERKLIDVTK